MTALTLSLLSQPALAFRHLEPPRVWLTQDLPIRWEIADDPTDPESGCTSMPDLNPGDCLEAAEAGFNAWASAPCVEFTHEYAGVCPNTTGFTNDGVTRITFNDPERDNPLSGLPDPGVLAAAQIYANTSTFFIDSIAYSGISNMDIVFNDGNRWTTDENVLPGSLA